MPLGKNLNFPRNSSAARRFSPSMKKFTLALTIAAATLFASQSSVLAQDPAPGANPPPAARPGGPGGARRMDPEARLKFMTEQLGLDADQQAKIKAIYEKNAAKIKELMAKGFENLTDADKTAMRDYFTSQLEEISTILTPEQQQKLKDMRPQGRGPRPEPSK